MSRRDAKKYEDWLLVHAALLHARGALELLERYVPPAERSPLAWQASRLREALGIVARWEPRKPRTDWHEVRTVATRVRSRTRGPS